MSLPDGITIDASGNDPKLIPVAGDGEGSRLFSIDTGNGDAVTLARLTITGGDVSGTNSGGGIIVTVHGIRPSIPFLTAFMLREMVEGSTEGWTSSRR